MFAEAGLDLDECMADYDHPSVDEPMFAQMLLELPESISDKYGISDIHG